MKKDLLFQEVTAAREALATLKPQAGGATPMMTPSHAPPTPTHPETPVHPQPQAQQVKVIHLVKCCFQSINQIYLPGKYYINAIIPIIAFCLTKRPRKITPIVFY